MTGRQARLTVSPLRATLFAVGVSLALIFVIFPTLPGSAEVGGRLVENHLHGEDVAATVIISLIAGGALGVHLYIFQPRELNTVLRLFMLALLIVVWVAAAKFFLAATLPDDDRLYLSYMLPVAASPMLIATLLEGSLAVAVAAVLALLTTFVGYYLPDARESLSEHPLDALQMATTFLLGGLVGIFAVHRAERMNRYLVAGGVVTCVSFAVLVAFWLLSGDRSADDPLWMIFSTGLGGFLSAVVVVGASVILGLMFGITTRMQLMELAQMNHPLLRRLQEQAPGTFHHSVIVGNLAERAADLVGADSLLVRVGCYFHDIGKVVKPVYYIENQMQGENPHDKLTPSASAKLVADHVHAGQELARRHRVPVRVRAFIPEHHGTRLVTYFYRKAAIDDATTDPEKFRYPGPRPQSRETAIVMLADSVEAVVRSSRDRSAERIDSLVDAVIAERVAEGQLDECDLTLRDLKTVGESFKTTLRGVYHPRIEYPAPTAAERATAAVGRSPDPLPGPMDGTAPPLEIERPSG
ncbi:MAG: HDIG domain-containing protein [Dehalococcoidia bacterium]|nr:HDIG domain-containing protein [Dehalococcoidia bacterium]